MSLLTRRENVVLLKVRASPGASRDALQGLRGEALKVAVQAPAEKGRANAAILALLARALELRPGQLELISGETSRDKCIAVSGVELDDLAARIDAALDKRAGP